MLRAYKSPMHDTSLKQEICDRRLKLSRVHLPLFKMTNEGQFYDIIMIWPFRTA